MEQKKEQEKIIRFSVSLPEALLETLDSKITQGYASRSEVIRDLIREKIVEDKWDASEDSIGVLVLVYNHHQRELNQKIIDLQHHADSKVSILCATHVHIKHNNCLETIIMRGIGSEIKKLALKIGGLRGVRFWRLTEASSLEV